MLRRLIALLCFAWVMATGGAPMGIVVPAYFAPPTYWGELNFAASRVPLMVIANPFNGPGPSLDSTYLASIKSVRGAGAKVIGYVHTSYAGRDTNAVIADLDQFFQWYPLDGIFIDEMANDANVRHQEYYAALYHYIQGKGTNVFVMGNPGTTTLEPYLATVDALITFEDFAGYSNYVADAWVTRHLARDFGHIIYAVTNAATMTNYIDLAASRNAGWIFVTDNTNVANPYDRLPSYWTNEVDYIRARNASQRAVELQAVPVTNGVPTLQLSGAAGVYELQISTNLLDWRTTATVNILTNSVMVKDAGSSNLPRRYYRARQ
jgi:hypothetical protein